MDDDNLSAKNVNVEVEEELEERLSSAEELPEEEELTAVEPAETKAIEPLETKAIEPIETKIEESEPKKEDTAPIAPTISVEDQEVDRVKADLDAKIVQIQENQRLKEDLLSQVKEVEKRLEVLASEQKQLEESLLKAKDVARRAKFKGGAQKIQATKNPTPNCALCGKKVYPTEKVLDSKEQVFHKLCLRCETCKKGLIGKEPIADDSIWKLLPAQYRIKVENDQTHLLCDSHGEITAKEVSHATTVEDIQKLKDDEMKTMKRATLIEKKKITAQRMEKELGPVILEGGRTPVRTMVKKALDRMIIVLSLDPEKKINITFMMDLDPSTKEKALLAKNYEPARLFYIVDTGANVDALRVFTAPYTEKNPPSFSILLREGKSFTNKDPNGDEYQPAINVKKRGFLSLKNAKTFFELTHDGLLKYGSEPKKLSKSLTLHVDYTFEISGSDNGNILIKDEKGKPVLEISAAHEDIAQDWIDAFNSVLHPTESNAGFERFSAYLFSVENDILFTIEIIMMISFQTKQIGCVSANVRISCWPPLTAKESETADPLKNLRVQMTMKRQLKETAAQSQTPPAMVEQEIKKAPELTKEISLPQPVSQAASEPQIQSQAASLPQSPPQQVAPKAAEQPKGKGKKKAKESKKKKKK